MQQDEKQQLLEAIHSGSVTSDDKRLQAIGLHFRMKGLNKGDAKSIKQLRADGSALMNEHP